jgi:formyl-CoA transferase
VLNAKINRLTEKKSAQTWVTELNARVPCGPIYSIDQMFDDAKFVSRHRPGCPEQRESSYPPGSSALPVSRTPSRMAARPPEFGEHKDEVLSKLGSTAGNCSSEAS